MGRRPPLSLFQEGGTALFPELGQGVTERKQQVRHGDPSPPAPAWERTKEEQE